MRIVYTDENRRLKDFGRMIDSAEFQSFVEQNLSGLKEYSYGSNRIRPYLCRERFHEFFKEKGFAIGEKTEHAHGIGNNNKTFVQDLESGEYIGALHLNADMHGGVYCYASDINKNVVSNLFFISERGMRQEKANVIDWDKYSFAEEERVLALIEEAISVGVLREGENGGVMVMEKWQEYVSWVEHTKENAAKDLMKQGEVQTLVDAVEERKLANALYERYKVSYLDVVCSDSVVVRSHEMVNGKLVLSLKDDYDQFGWVHVISEKEQNELEITDFAGTSIYNYAYEKGWNEEQVYFMKHGHVPFEECKEGLLLEYKGIHFDEWTIDKEEGSIWGEMCECCAEKYKEILKDELSDGGVGACSVEGCLNRGDDENAETHYYVDFKPEFVRFVPKVKELEKEVHVDLNEKIQGAADRVNVEKSNVDSKKIER